MPDSTTTLYRLDDVVIGSCPAPPTDQHPAPSRRRGALVAVVAVALLFAAAATLGDHHTTNPRQASRERLVATTPDPPMRPGQTVRLFDHTFQLPYGIHVVNRGDTYVSARGEHAGLDVTVFRGSAAARQATAPPPAPMRVHHAPIAGHPAVIDAYGAGPAGPSSLEIRVRTTRSELVWVDSEGVSPDALVTMLTAALHG